MEISVVREASALESRVALTPGACGALVAAGHAVFVEAGAGESAGHDDARYTEVGARLVWSHDEALARGQLVLKVRRPTVAEVGLLRQGAIVAGLLHLEGASDELNAALVDKQVTALALEHLDEKGARPVLTAMSEIAGRLAPQLAARCLEWSPEEPGRGVLMAGLPGVPSAEIVILGAGTVGFNAARAFTALGAQVTLLDNRVSRLREVELQLQGRVGLLHATARHIRRSVGYADVLVGAAYRFGRPAPRLVSVEQVKAMRPGAAILDFAIDHGGCVETSRPTTPARPTYREHGIVHCCLPNSPTLVPRSASHALAQASLPLLRMLSAAGNLRDALRAPEVWPAVAVYEGTRPDRAPTDRRKLGGWM